MFALRVAPVALAGFALLASTAGPPSSRPPARTCATVLGSPVCTWVVSKAGSPVEIHAAIPLALVTAVPDDPPMHWPPVELGSVPLPDLARQAFGLDHLGINWEAHGHPPATFMTPHFDFHFYNLAPAKVDAIDCHDQTKPAAIPAGFALPDVAIPDLGTLVGLCVPKMGMHAVPESDLAATDPFGASPLVGYYDGQAIFVEPMVARARLLAKKDFSMTVPTVAHLPAGVRYPRTIRGHYDRARNEYLLILTDFPAR
jgi:hypothetical protein